jgi:glycosyltransferase involved in cell wall biosynthesis
MTVEQTLQPLVTIVTPSFNQAKYLEQTILSVLSQDYAPIEYIVVDGASTDGSRAILEKYSGRLQWISEPDQGQADAINKGFRMGRGDILGWLNADDLYMPQAVSQAVEQFTRNPEVSFLYGNAVAIDDENRSYGIRTHVHQTNYNELVFERDYIVQPAAFWRTSLWKTAGELDTSLKYTLDYEYWMRLARSYRLLFVPVCLAQERIYAQTKSFGGSLERYDEIERVAVRHGGNGMPRGYHAEACAAYLFEAMRCLFRRRMAEMRLYLNKAAHLRPPLFKFAAKLIFLLVLGPQNTAQFTLKLNQLRNRLKPT